VASKDGSKIRRFLVMDVIQLILVEPDTRRLGWGVAKFVGFLQVCAASIFINLLYTNIGMDYLIMLQ
jgi:hypothetical protein